MNQEASTMHSFIMQIGQQIMNVYWGKIYSEVKKNHQLISSVTGFLIKPEKLMFYIGKNHLAIEYIGSEILDELPTKF